MTFTNVVHLSYCKADRSLTSIGATEEITAKLIWDTAGLLIIYGDLIIFWDALATSWLTNILIYSFIHFLNASTERSAGSREVL